MFTSVNDYYEGLLKGKQETLEETKKQVFANIEERHRNLNHILENLQESNKHLENCSKIQDDIDKILADFE